MENIRIPKGVRVYLSGPISGYDPDERKDYFCEMQRKLILRGLEAVNPFENGLSDWRPRTEHMAADLRMLLGCYAILMLDGWQKSAGACLELMVAYQCGIKVIMGYDNIILDEEPF